VPPRRRAGAELALEQRLGAPRPAAPSSGTRHRRCPRSAATYRLSPTTAAPLGDASEVSHVAIGARNRPSPSPAPSTSGQPPLLPSTTWFTSSKRFCPNSTAYSRPASSKASPCTLRWPRDRTSVSAPGAGAPAGVMRRTLPPSEPGSCDSAVSPVSPVPAYSRPSGPKARRPPLWIVPFGMPVRTGSSADGSSVDIRTMRLSCSVVT
jgi:hypothetical protein